MNFGEKLTNLRKQKGLSQEELGEELKVTRQTISKWELGQTSPDTNKLTEIAGFFGVSTDELTNNKEVKYNDYNNNTNTEDNKRSTISIVLIIILVLLLVGIVVYATWLAFEGSIFKKAFNLQDKILNKSEQFIEQGIDKVNQLNNEFAENSEKTRASMKEEYENAVNNMNEEYEKQVSQSQEKYNIRAFNNKLEMYSGTKYGTSIRNLLDTVITNNKTNKEHIITVTYKENNTTEEDNIVEIKHSFDKFTEYEVSLYYDTNGYVNKVTIKDI